MLSLVCSVDMIALVWVCEVTASLVTTNTGNGCSLAAVDDVFRGDFFCVVFSHRVPCWDLVFNCVSD